MPRLPSLRPAGLIAAAALIGLLCSGSSAAERAKPTFTKPKYDPSAREVDLFAGIEEGELEVKMIPKDAKGGNLLIENTTDEPLTVKMPNGFVGVQVFKQIGGGLGGGGLGGGGGGLGGGGGGQGGGQQNVGGGMGGGGLGGGGGGLGGGGMGGGGGFFSVPAESVARLPYQSVCLEHGKPEPNPRSTYEIRAVESFTEDENLRQLIGLIGSNRVNLEAAQAAAWHLTDDMSWAELASLKVERLGGAAPQPYFAPGALSGGQTLVSAAVAKAEKVKSESDETEQVAAPAATTKPIR